MAGKEKNSVWEKRNPENRDGDDDRQADPLDGGRVTGNGVRVGRVTRHDSWGMQVTKSQSKTLGVIGSNGTGGWW